MNAYTDALAAYEAAYALCIAAREDADWYHGEHIGIKRRFDCLEQIIAEYDAMPADQALAAIAARVQQLGDDRDDYDDVLNLLEENSIYAAHQWAGEQEEETGNRPDDAAIWLHAIADARSDHRGSLSDSEEAYLPALRTLRQRAEALLPLIQALTVAVREVSDQHLGEGGEVIALRVRLHGHAEQLMEIAPMLERGFFEDLDDVDDDEGLGNGALEDEGIQRDDAMADLIVALNIWRYRLGQAAPAV